MSMNNNRPSAGTFNGKPIFWWVVPESVCYPVDADGEQLKIGVVLFDRDIIHVGDDDENRWSFYRFIPSPYNNRFTEVETSVTGPLSEMQELFLQDLKALESRPSPQNGTTMKAKEVQLGESYSARLSSGQRVNVRIESTMKGGGWNATNTATGKKVKITSVRMILGAPDDSVEIDAPTEAVSGEAKARKKTKREDGTLSGLDAAVRVLSQENGPLNCKAIVERAAADGLWNPAGKTPAATLYSAILREIIVKGDQSRFIKTERGHFTLAEGQGSGA